MTPDHTPSWREHRPVDPSALRQVEEAVLKSWSEETMQWIKQAYLPPEPRS
jgi:hypothetical protein